MGFGKFGVVVGAALAAALAATPAAHAANNNGYTNSPHSYVALMPGYFYADKGHDATRTGFTLSGILGYQFAPQWEVELNLFGTDINTGPSVPTDFYQEGLSVDLAYNLFGTDRTGWLTPFVIAGVGGVYDDVSPNRYDSVNFQANAGLGVVTGPLFKSGLLAGLKLRAEARYLYDRFQSATKHGMNDARASIGIELPIGMPTPPPPPPPPPPQVKVVHTPAPPPQIIHCPSPFPGAKLDKYGCAIAPQTVVLHGVHFAFNKATLEPDAQTLLSLVAAAMKSQSSMTVQIAGFTDDIGSQAYNQKLSERRADSVRSYLITQGVDGKRMTTIGYGEDKPIVTPQNTAAARAQNRRVEFHILTP